MERLSKLLQSQFHSFIQFHGNKLKAWGFFCRDGDNDSILHRTVTYNNGAGMYYHMINAKFTNSHRLYCQEEVMLQLHKFNWPQNKRDTLNCTRPIYQCTQLNFAHIYHENDILSTPQKPTSNHLWIMDLLNIRFCFKVNGIRLQVQF